ncbi:WD_REPEATS_REGION domain-containing protein, partial [Haematococcus lacustris]
MLDSIPTAPPQASNSSSASSSSALVVFGQEPAAKAASKEIMRVIQDKGHGSAAVSRRLASKWPKPVWHAPWR